jgi:hypothetical protein
MADRDRLFVLRPGFDDKGARWFCPYSAQVIGYLAYYPAVRETLDVIELDFPRPRHPLVELVGEANQSMPCLVLGDDAPIGVEGVATGSHEGQRFVGKTIEILRYLATTRGTPLPH